MAQASAGGMWVTAISMARYVEPQKRYTNPKASRIVKRYWRWSWLMRVTAKITDSCERDCPPVLAETVWAQPPSAVRPGEPGYCLVTFRPPAFATASPCGQGYNVSTMNCRRHHGMSSVPASPGRLRWNLAFPRVALLHVPSRSRPNLFGGD